MRNPRAVVVARACRSTTWLIHDWIRATSVPGRAVDRTLALVQDYDNHKNIYKPDVID